MKLPWISRAEYERELAKEHRRADHWHEVALELAKAVKQQDAPKRLTSPYTPPVPQPPKEPDPVQQLIREQSTENGRVNHALQQHLRNYADDLKRQGKTPDEIQGELVKWATTEPTQDMATWQ